MKRDLRPLSRPILVAVVAVAAATIAASSGPTTASSGYNGWSCNGCHPGAINSGGGSLTIVGAPTSYAPSTTYNFQVVVTDPGPASRWGFQVSVRDANGVHQGTVSTSADPGNTQTNITNHIGQTAAGTNTQQWTVRWTSPSVVVPVTIYSSGLAADNSGDKNGDNTYNATWNIPNSPLPVELIVFDGLVNGNDAVLKWTTASEQSNIGFDVQHSVGTQPFSAVAFVPGAGTTLEEQHYQISIPDLDSGTHRFRLRQVDVGGLFSYSAMIELAVDLPTQFVMSAVYPNPFASSAAFQLVVEGTQHVRISLYDILGREVLPIYDGVAVEKESRTFSIDAGSLPGGTYFVRARGDNFEESRVVALAK